MKVIENSKNRLVLEHRPIKLAVLLSGALLFVVAISLGLLLDRSIFSGIFVLLVSLACLIPFLLIGVERTRLTMDRDENKVYFQRKTLTGWSGEWHHLADLNCAEIEKNTSRDGTLYRPVVSFKQQSKIDQIALVQIFSSSQQSHAAVDAVNKWLELCDSSLQGVS